MTYAEPYSMTAGTAMDAISVAQPVLKLDRNDPFIVNALGIAGCQPHNRWAHHRRV